VSGAFLDLVVYAYHNYQPLKQELHQNCYFYLPKIASFEEALLWEQVLSKVEQMLGAAPHSFKVSVIVENLIAALELEEIIFALRKRIVAINAGRWNYISSILKITKGNKQDFLMPRGKL